MSNNFALNVKDNVSKKINNLINSNRFPHAVVLCCKDLDILNCNVTYLSLWAICSSVIKPCFSCAQCDKILNNCHVDVYYAKKFGKKQVVNVDEIRFICSDAYIKPNEGRAKVYIIEDCDKMQIEAQNAFLKILEEPPQDILFILTCSNYENILSTVRSRATLIELETENSKIDEISLEIATCILNALCENTEYNLLLATNKLSDKNIAYKTMDYIQEVVDKTLVSSYKTNDFDDVLFKNLSSSINKKNLISIIELVDTAKDMLNSNVNMNLFTTWICSSLRNLKYL